MSARYIVGNVLDVLRSMPDASVDLVLSSPPFLALRSYLPADHPDKAKEIGSEPTPGAFIDTLLNVVEECRRVLAPHGSLCFELGDTYAGSGCAGGDYNANGLREGQPRFRQNNLYTSGYSGGVHGRNTKKTAADIPLNGGPGWPLDKSLCLVPELLRVAMVYGFNPLTGRTTPRWRARNVVRWHRPNPPVGALGDKFRPSTSDMLVACVSGKRYFDLDAVRTPTQVQPQVTRVGPASASRGISGGDSGNPDKERLTHNPAGAPPLDTWVIPTEPYRGSHYATFPTDLLVKPILSMCPQRVCTTCGKPSERIVDVSYERNGGGTTGTRRNLAEPDGRTNGTGMTAKPTMAKVSETTGWTSCGHGTWRKGVVLDPFGGSGTTAVVALGHGRDAVLIDLDERNAELARQRVGMWLEVEQHAAETVA